MALSEAAVLKILDLAFTGVFTVLNQNEVMDEAKTKAFDSIDDVGDWLQDKVKATSDAGHAAIAAKRRDPSP